MAVNSEINMEWVAFQLQIGILLLQRIFNRIIKFSAGLRNHCYYDVFGVHIVEDEYEHTNSIYGVSGILEKNYFNAHINDYYLAHVLYIDEGILK